METHVSLLRRSATPTARIRRYSLQGPGARGMSLLETSSFLLYLCHKNNNWYCDVIAIVYSRLISHYITFVIGYREECTGVYATLYSFVFMFPCMFSCSLKYVFCLRNKMLLNGNLVYP